MTTVLKWLFVSSFVATCSCSSVTDTSGREWIEQERGTTNTLYAVSGTSPTDVWAVGERGTILHFDGTQWSPHASGVQDDVLGVWGSSPNDVFAVTLTGSVLHFDGTAWSEQTGFPRLVLRGVWGSAPNSVFIFGATFDNASLPVVLHYNGSMWSADTVRDGATMEALWGPSSANVVAVGGGGFIGRYDGSRWEPERWLGISWFLGGVCGSAVNNAFAVGEVQDGFANREGAILHYDGASWTRVPVELRDLPLRRAWGASSHDMFAIGSTNTNNSNRHDGVILHYNGRRWSESRRLAFQPLLDVWGAEGDVFVVGGGGFILRGSL